MLSALGFIHRHHNIYIFKAVPHNKHHNKAICRAEGEREGRSRHVYWWTCCSDIGRQVTAPRGCWGSTSCLLTKSGQGLMTFRLRPWAQWAPGSTISCHNMFFTPVMQHEKLHSLGHLQHDFWQWFHDFLPLSWNICGHNLWYHSKHANFKSFWFSFNNE